MLEHPDDGPAVAILGYELLVHDLMGGQSEFVEQLTPAALTFHYQALEPAREIERPAR